ncbi:MAG: TetR/AcrR family transcriptional regulator, cholesterol catabolism regulator [Betaproteobacteria bacterium]|nr:TetR/AcrR family transcriptional regulator, cholesterol catabolism regulator [Betaproteobacteria bacterium]
MPRRKTAKVELSRGRLLDAAAHIFRERGYVGTTMRAIAQDAGIEAGSIYYHYKSKDELIGAVLDFGIVELLSSVTSALSQLPADATPRLRIETAIRAHVSAILDNGHYMLAMRRVFGQVPAATWRRHVRLRESYGEVWSKLLSSARRAGVVRADADLTVARLFLLGGLNWTVEWYKPKGRPVHAVTHAFASLILDGLLVPRARQARKPKK